MRRLIAIALLSICGAEVAAAQPGVTSVVRTVSMSATKPSALSVTIISGATQSLAPLTDNAISTFPTPVRIMTSWTLSPGTASVRLLAFFSVAPQALANGTNYITSARVQGRVQTTPVTAWQPTNWRAFTQNGFGGVGVNGATLRLMNMPITAANRSSSRTMDLQLRINLVGQPPATAGTYSGTITLRAVTT
ncbi:MAG: hypothetical protein ACT4OZ_06755 [Gemmatimonadota bacterium]